MKPRDAHEVTEKAWGTETLIANRAFCGKAMTLRAGHRCSLHYHQTKDETFLVTSGRVLVEIGDPGWMARYTVRQGRPVGVGAEEILARCRQFVLEPGMSIDVEPYTVHRFTGLDASQFFEFSTHDDPEDSVRLTQSERVPEGATSD